MRRSVAVAVSGVLLGLTGCGGVPQGPDDGGEGDVQAPSAIRWSPEGETVFETIEIEFDEAVQTTAGDWKVTVNGKRQSVTAKVNERIVELRPRIHFVGAEWTVEGAVTDLAGNKTRVAPWSFRTPGAWGEPETLPQLDTLKLAQTIGGESFAWSDAWTAGGAPAILAGPLVRGDWEALSLVAVQLSAGSSYPLVDFAPQSDGSMVLMWHHEDEGRVWWAKSEAGAWSSPKTLRFKTDASAYFEKLSTAGVLKYVSSAGLSFRRFDGNEFAQWEPLPFGTIAEQYQYATAVQTHAGITAVVTPVAATVTEVAIYRPGSGWGEPVRISGWPSFGEGGVRFLQPIITDGGEVIIVASTGQRLFSAVISATDVASTVTRLDANSAMASREEFAFERANGRLVVKWLELTKGSGGAVIEASRIVFREFIDGSFAEPVTADVVTSGYTDFGVDALGRIAATWQGDKRCVGRYDGEWQISCDFPNWGHHRDLLVEPSGRLAFTMELDWNADLGEIHWFE